MSKKNSDDITKGLDREAAVEKMALAFNLEAILDLTKLETLFFTCVHAARIGIDDPYKSLLPLTAWLLAK
jgi:hypothetical protein